ncbi:MAG: IS200/IS605 family transposase, partial [Leptolyngbya sp. Prado105]|nr:IS200/IS605 family transposase [Leptolyngbya sp. Prado105]
MTLWKTYYHLVWATQNRLPLITESIEAELYGYIQNKTKSIECPIYAIGGMPDHIHLIVSIPPSRAVSGYVMR